MRAPLLASMLAAAGALATLPGSGLAQPSAGQDEASDRPAAELSQEQAAAKIDAFHQLLIQAMQTPARGDRLAALGPAVAGLFDIPSISRISLGRTWRSLEEAARAGFQDLLRTLIVATYADRFDSYDGQRFDHLGAQPAGRGWVVKTQLVRANGERVNLDYYFNGAAVYNLVADGVSDLSLRRADYNSIIKEKGYDALLRHIEENIAELGGASKGEET